MKYVLYFYIHTFCSTCAVRVFFCCIFLISCFPCMLRRYYYYYYYYYYSHHHYRHYYNCSFGSIRILFLQFYTIPICNSVCYFIYSLIGTLYLLLTIIYSLQNNFIVLKIPTSNISLVDSTLFSKIIILL